MLNHIAIMGRLTRDPELRRTESGVAVANFTLAVDRDYSKGSEKETDFIDCVAWGNTAEFISKYFKKGASIFVFGTLHNRSWTDQNGQKRYATEVVADEAMFVESKSDSSSQGSYSPEAYSAPSFSSGANDAPKFEDVNTDDSFLPF